MPPKGRFAREPGFPKPGRRGPEGRPGVHVVGGSGDGRIDARIQPGAATGTLSKDGHQVRVTIIGSDGYFHADRAGMQMMGIPREAQGQVAGR